jgi:hypothetical protein
VRQCLDAALDPVRLEIDDESAHHLGHAGAASAGGHYMVTIVSERFRDCALIALDPTDRDRASHQNRALYNRIVTAIQYSRDAGHPNAAAPHGDDRLFE